MLATGSPSFRTWLAAFACVITAHDARTGAELWRRRTIPAPGEPGERPTTSQAADRSANLYGCSNRTGRRQAAAVGLPVSCRRARAFMRSRPRYSCTARRLTSMQ